MQEDAKVNIAAEISKLYPRISGNNNYAYGDNLVAATYCGFKNVPKQINGEWQHGHIVPERNIHPGFVVGSEGLSLYNKHKKYFVARFDQVDYLKLNGYKDVIAVGMPVVYLAKPSTDRIKNSLLIMPVHSLQDTKETWDESEYVSYIDKISPEFTKIVCCLHKSDWDKNYWKTFFSERQLEIIIGADEEDANSLPRLAYLFSRFEYVTSNGFGSHIAYASFFGAKPSIAGPQPKWRREDFSELTFYKNCPECLDILEQWRDEKLIENRYPFLFVDPNKAESQKAWAEFQLGFDNKKTPRELKMLFGWDSFSIFKRRVKTVKSIITDALKNNIKPYYQWIYLCLNGLLAQNKIFTHLTINEKILLYKVAKKLPFDAICLEIGSFLGSSSSFIAKGLKVHGKLICIDTWGNQNMKYEEKDTDAEERDTYSEFVTNTKQHRGKIIEIRKWSFDAIMDVRQVTEKIDFLFIDGDHNYQGVKNDWDLYSPLLRKGGFVAFHDTGWAEGVKRVINENVIPIAKLINQLPNMEIYQVVKTD